MEYNNLENINIQVIKENDYTSVNIASLSSLYLPIIGAKSFSMYLFLFNETTIGNQLDLQDFLQFSLEDYKEAKSKLEALNLIKTNLVDDNNSKIIEFNIIRPLSAKEFLNNKYLSRLLLSRIGEFNYLNIKEKFINDNEKNKKVKKNISVSFRDVFSNELENFFNKNVNNMGIKNQKNKFEEFRSLAIKNGISNSEIIKNKRIIEGLLNALNTNISDLIDNIKLNLNIKNNEIDIDQVQKFFLNESNQKQIINDKEKQHNKEIDHKNEKELNSELVNIATKYSPFDFLSIMKKKKNGVVTKSELNSLTYTIPKYNLPNAVINVLIYYLLDEKNESHIKNSLFETILDEWQQKGINTPEKAIFETGNRNSVSKNHNKKSTNNKKKINYNPPVMKESLSDDDINNIKERISKNFG